jgi:hypothetical protein
VMRLSHILCHWQISEINIVVCFWYVILNSSTIQYHSHILFSFRFDYSNSVKNTVVVWESVHSCTEPLYDIEFVFVFS